MSKELLVDKVGYKIYGENHEGCLFLHCDVINTSISNLKDLKESFLVILSEAEGIGEPSVYSVTPNIRFVDFLKVPYKILSEFNDGRLVTWELK